MAQRKEAAQWIVSHFGKEDEQRKGKLKKKATPANEWK